MNTPMKRFKSFEEDTTSGTSNDNERKMVVSCLTTENIQQIMSHLTMPERFAFISTQKKMYQEEPLAIKYTSFCTKCDNCRSKNQHLCHEQDNERPLSFWKTLCQSPLIQLRLASCPALDDEFFINYHQAFLKKILNGLEVLDLNKCNQIGPKGLYQIANACRNLRELKLRDMHRLDGMTLRRFFENNHKTLQIVDLCGCHTITGHDLQGLKLCKATLKDLTLRGCYNVDNKAIIGILEHCNQLTRLNLRYCHKVDDQVIVTMTRCLPFLRDLNIRYCYKITDIAVMALCKHLPLLETLNLSQNSRITDASIVQIVSSLSCLKELRLWGCTKLTSASVYAISIGLPSLTLVDIRSRDKFEAVIGGQTALKFFIQTYRHTLRKWEQAEQVGVFKRSLSCMVVAS